MRSASSGCRPSRVKSSPACSHVRASRIRYFAPPATLFPYFFLPPSFSLQTPSLPPPRCCHTCEAVRTGAQYCCLIASDRHHRQEPACVSTPHLHILFCRSLLSPLHSQPARWRSISNRCSSPLLMSLPRLIPSLSPQSRLGSQSDAMAIQSIRNVRGNSFCVDCDAASE